MFKIGKLEEIKEKVNINFITLKKEDKMNGSTIEFKTLTFDIESIINDKKVSFCFDFNCPFEDLLKIERYKTVDFNNYISDSDKNFIINNQVDFDPLTDFKITRWINNKYIIEVSFFGKVYFKDGNTDYYAVKIEIDLNLDDYLDNKK